MSNDQSDMLAEELGAIHSVLSTILSSTNGIVINDEVAVLLEYSISYIEKAFLILEKRY